MIGEYLRLAFATGLVLLPGYLVAWALGRRGAAPGFVWAFACLFLAWAAVFVVHATISLALWILAAIGAGALATRPWGRHGLARRPGADGQVPLRAGWMRAGVLGGGVAFGLALWHVEGAVVGDALFHEAVVRKLVELHHLHLRSMDALAQGGLHPGYAFPLWHGFLALVARLSGLDPSIVIRREASVLVPIACLAAWEAGVALFRSAAGGVGVLAGSLALYCLAAGHGGSWVSLALPATSARQLLLPAALAAFFTYAASAQAADLATTAVAFGAIALVHSSYALFALLPLAAYAVIRAPELRRTVPALVATLLPVGAVALWLRPLVNETLTVHPTDNVQRQTLAHYGPELVGSIDHFRVAAGMPARTGAVAVAALALLPLAGFAARRRWGAYVLGGGVLLLALVLVPDLFVRFSNAVSLSQSRRASGFVPLAFAFAGGLALLARSVYLVPLALVAGIVLEHEWRGDFSASFSGGGPGAVTWWALAAGSVALAAGLAFGRDRPRERWGLGALAACLFVLPVAWYAARHWTPLTPVDRTALPPALVQRLRRLPKGTVVIASPGKSYEIAAAAPVYIVAAPLPHVANTKANDPVARRNDVERWLTTGDPAIPRRYGATWAVRRNRLIPLTS